eukprot:CAMPEP_0184309484 /NCGR_PEP_ID=MMETSP1049-20130417/17628_1 /TAXON_ID=77928 /ORGANISM="Proteomonas sulcata, Strain CCMP704" /LENGTH=200 /DNA_ID=CAMNT_0026622367 /DNA_START=37 /DNA_END=636 /DNA_ORIENTATION=-
MRLLLALLLACWAEGIGAQITISAVWPSIGSMAGGTRIHIHGSGFADNQGTVNVVSIGSILCDPILLHCTPARIACKTRSAEYGMFHDSSTSSRLTLEETEYGWSKQLPVRVSVGVETSTCESTDNHGCTFKYDDSTVYTPRLRTLYPVNVCMGTMITLTGQWYENPFHYNELRAPHREVPLASVKIANRDPEQQQPQNE